MKMRYVIKSHWGKSFNVDKWLKSKMMNLKRKIIKLHLMKKVKVRIKVKN